MNSPENTSELLPIIPKDTVLYYSNVDTNHADSNDTQGRYFIWLTI